MCLIIISVPSLVYKVGVPGVSVSAAHVLCSSVFSFTLPVVYLWFVHYLVFVFLFTVLDFSLACYACPFCYLDFDFWTTAYIIKAHFLIVVSASGSSSNILFIGFVVHNALSGKKYGASPGPWVVSSLLPLDFQMEHFKDAGFVPNNFNMFFFSKNVLPISTKGLLIIILYFVALPG